jgi:hypothetical protein
MTKNSNAISLSTDNERVIREYFEPRPGWNVTKLDTGKEQAADFRVCDNHDCFLCEVKTIESVRANFSYTSLDYYLEQREKRQNEIEQWKKEDPKTHLILDSGEWKFIYGDKVEFENRYRYVRRNTEEWFKKFTKAVEDHFANSSIGGLPYNIRIDSDDLYVPNKREKEDFFKWLENEMQAIHRGEISRDWQILQIPDTYVTWYSSSYQIHKPSHEKDTIAYYQLAVEGPFENGCLNVSLFSYGGLNLKAIESEIEGGLKQLGSSALRETDQQIPRIIVLAFASWLGFERKELPPYIAKILQTHQNLSAIAILDWIPDRTPPTKEEDSLAWEKFCMIMSMVPRFIVFHNPWLKNVKQLPAHIFNDKWSIQVTPPHQ